MVDYSVSLNFGTPADRVDIWESHAISGKNSFQHGWSIITVHQRKTACWCQIFWSDLVNTEDINRRNLPSSLLWQLFSPKGICVIRWRFSNVGEQTSPSWHATYNVYRRRIWKLWRIFPVDWRVIMDEFSEKLVLNRGSVRRVIHKS